MKTIVRSTLAAVAGLLASLLVIGSLGAQEQITREQVSFEAGTARDGGVTVKGELRIPPSQQPRLPAVLVLHGSGGKDDGRDAYYIEALNKAGFATLEIDMFPAGGRPQIGPRATMPHGYGSLLFLARHPKIDPARIGVIGFSYGGMMTLLQASEEVTQEYTGGKARFAAHLAHYPVCFLHLNVVAGRAKTFSASTYSRLTGAPVHIVIGDKDDFDEPDTCPKLVAALPEESRRYVAVTVHPGAYHAFDSPGTNTMAFDQFGYMGRGGNVRYEFDEKVAARSRQFAVEFFSRHLLEKK